MASWISTSIARVPALDAKAADESGAHEALGAERRVTADRATPTESDISVSTWLSQSRQLTLVPW
jgi:hypothetical protein